MMGSDKSSDMSANSFPATQTPAGGKTGRSLSSKLASQTWPLTLVVIGCLALAQALLTPLLQKEVVVRGGDVDVGMVKRGQIVNSTMTITNMSPFFVNMSAQPGCGCTLLSVTSSTLYPFSHTELKSAINTSQFHVGHVSKPIFFNFQSGTVRWDKVSKIDLTVL